MSERVPEGWSQYKVEQIGPFFNGLTGKTSSDFGKGEPFLNYMQIFKQQLSYNSGAGFVEILEGEKQNTVQYGDILFTTSSETPAEIGMTAVFLETKWSPYLNSFCFGLRPHKNFPLVPEFANQFFRGDTFREDIRPLAQGSTRYNLSKENLKQLSITIPPLSEQKRIASILTSVDEVIEKTQSLIDKLQDLKTGTMNELLTKGIGHTEFKDSELGRIPKSWVIDNLGSCFSLTSGKSKPTRLLSSNVSKIKSIPVFGGNGITGFTDSALLAKETIVIGRVGEYCGCVHITPKNSWVTDNALYIKEVTKNCDLVFLFHMLNFLNLAKLRNKGGQPLISQQPISDLVAAIPPIEEQKKIAAVLTHLDEQHEIGIKKLHQTQSLKKSLMQDLLTGEVRVTVK